MSQIAGTNVWGFSPYTGQGFGAQPFQQQPYAQTPLNLLNLSNPIGGGSYGINPYAIGTVPVQQIAQLLQIVPQQLQQLQLLQQQQLLHLQQLLQWVPAQLQQLQQLIQIVPQQVQQLQQLPQLQQHQLQGQPFAAGISGPLGFGLVPQAFAGPVTSHVM